MPDSFEIAKQPNPSGVGKPTSGTYGEKASTDRLKAALPAVESQPQSGMTLPTPSTGPLPQPGQGVGLPSVLMAPTQRPNTPVSTPLAAPPVNPVAGQSGLQQRLAFFDALANNPGVSDETREWADVVVRRLVEASSS